eukprot:1099526-Pyramimonas_sp.AAC.1
MTHDLEFAAGVVDSEAIDVLLNGMNTFSNKEEMEDFCMLDMGVLRASRSRVQVPPTGFLLASERLERPPAAPDGDPQFSCRASTETGLCGAAFHT